MSHHVAALACLLVMLLVSGRAHGWIENTVVGHEARITLSRDGKAVVEQRLTLRTNGNERLKSYRLVGIDDDAEPLANAYVVPARDALSSSLASALPLKLEIVKRKNDEEGNARPTELDLRVDDARGLWRGEYVFVFRYGTDLRARQRIAPDGAMVRVEWHGPILDAGLTSVRVVFLVPASPTAPRPFEGADKEDGDLEPNVISEVRKGNEHDELDLLRTYAPEKHSIVWAIRVDQRALEAPPKLEAPPSQAPSGFERPARGQLGIAVLLFAGYFLLVWLRAREVRRIGAAAHAIVRAVIPIPDVLRALLAALALTAGVALELVLREPIWGAVCVVAACALAAHGAARIDPKSARRGPGRWLTVSDREVFGKLPRLRGAVLDVSTWAGKAMLLVLMGGVGVACWWLSRRSPSQALLIGLDSVALLAVFGTGRMRALPPDLAVEPARLLRKIAAKLRKKKGITGVRIVPRIRVPQGGVDADELRLLIAPRTPLRGFIAIEVGVSYALGTGARIPMPEVLVRYVEGSICERALTSVARSGRTTPGRKPEERVIAIAPRLPTIHMTVEIVAALAARVTDRGIAEPVRADLRTDVPIRDVTRRSGSSPTLPAPGR